MRTDFASLKLSPDLIEVLKEVGFKELTPIQAQSIPLLLEGRDVLGQSKTGSGKTAAFALPILHKIRLGDKRLQALVLCPTRELCNQVAREVRRLGRKQPGLQVLILAGGIPIGPQIHALEKGVHIVVGTPGRVIDHMKRRSLDLGTTATVVLDEADRMLDMGFEEDMARILGATPEKRQTVFFSATFPASIEAMSRRYQKNPAKVVAGEANESPVNIRQTYYLVEQTDKVQALLWLLQQHQPESAIVFCNQKTTVSEVARQLKEAGVSADCLHGDLEQSHRDRVMAKFRNLSTRLLVASDVAARGLDIANLDIVFNFDIPPKPVVYVHRIGRTGRAGKSGLAISFFTPREKGKLRMLEDFTEVRLDEKSIPGKRQLEAETVKAGRQQAAAMDTLYISGGRKEKMRPGDILGALTGEAGGLNAADIGKIEIQDHFSYVAVSRSISEIALNRLRLGKIKGRRFRIERVR